MCQRWSHTLSALNELTSIKRNSRWTEVELDAFNKIKLILANDTLLIYQDFNVAFKIHTDAITFQLGVVIIQRVKPIDFYSKKLTSSQQWYTLTGRELLSILETLKEFRTISIGQKLRIYTNHKDLKCNFFDTNRVLRWRLMIEEYGPDIEYIKVENNIVAEKLSRIILNGN